MRIPSTKYQAPQVIYESGAAIRGIQLPSAAYAGASGASTRRALRHVRLQFESKWNSNQSVVANFPGTVPSAGRSPSSSNLDGRWRNCSETPDAPESVTQ